MNFASKFPADYVVIRDRIAGLYRELNTSDPNEVDRVETTICGYVVRVWRTRINCRERIHLGHRTKWERSFHPDQSVLRLTEQLYRHRGSDELHGH